MTNKFKYISVWPLDIETTLILRIMDETCLKDCNAKCEYETMDKTMHGLEHLGFAVVIFFVVIFVTCFLKYQFQRNFSSELFGAAVSASMFYWGREMRDLEKLKRMDWEGLFVPFGGIVFLFFVFSCVLCCNKNVNYNWYQLLEDNED